MYYIARDNIKYNVKNNNEILYIVQMQFYVFELGKLIWNLFMKFCLIYEREEG